MKRGVTVTLIVVLMLGTGLVAAVASAGADGEDGVTEAIETADTVESAIDVASETTTQLISGAVVGTGLGLVAGSGVTFWYWRRQIG